MKKLFSVLVLLLPVLWNVSAQVRIEGLVTDKNKLPLPGANIYIQNTYDGTTADSLGRFSFKTSQKGIQQLSVSFIGYQPSLHKLNLDSARILTLNVTLMESDDQLNEVVINAGAFEASDEKKAVIMRVFDIATTPSAQGDIFGALGTLPGVQKVGEDGRVFVRGGEGYETKTFMDGMLVSSPYMSKMPDIPTRGRFSPMLFSGTLFSTGAYSAEYGQALSSIVDMTTNSPETEERSSISLMTVGVMGSTTLCADKSSLTLSADYVTSELSNKINKQQVEWLKSPEAVNATLMYRQKTGKTGLYKSFATFSNNSSAMLYPNLQAGLIQQIMLNSDNVYFNNTFNCMPADKWMIKSGLAVNYDHQNVDLNKDNVTTNQKMLHAKLGLVYFLNDKAEMKVGGDWVHFSYEQKISMGGNFRLPFTNNELSAFSEMEYKVSKKFAARMGVRLENSSLLEKSTLVPRVSMAYKTGNQSQVSLAGGEFYQNPENDYLKFAPRLRQEKSRHAVMTWQYQTDLKTFRIEGYLKEYDHLVKFTRPLAVNPLDYSNTGSGHAQGVDIFWRDKKTIDLSDYWISYSWINASRNYRDYQASATPNFVSEHNLSVVFKRFLEPLRTYASATYSFASSRPYHDPNLPGFMNSRTQSYNDISLSLTYMLELFGNASVLHLMVNNVTGFENVYGYNFSGTPNAAGRYESTPIKSPYDRQIILLVSILL
ncbi:MAG TPA: TonB-dependent receptor [Prolixibacteraceae bacterium]|nr:TonB-dependent receptor [Prolixibacteraceae bacterium]